MRIWDNIIKKICITYFEFREKFDKNYLVVLIMTPGTQSFIRSSNRHRISLGPQYPNKNDHHMANSSCCSEKQLLATITCLTQKRKSHHWSLSLITFYFGPCFSNWWFRVSIQLQRGPWIQKETNLFGCKNHIKIN